MSWDTLQKKVISIKNSQTGNLAKSLKITWVNKHGWWGRSWAIVCGLLNWKGDRKRKGVGWTSGDRASGGFTTLTWRWGVFSFFFFCRGNYYYLICILDYVPCPSDWLRTTSNNLTDVRGLVRQCVDRCAATWHEHTLNTQKKYLLWSSLEPSW